MASGITGKTVICAVIGDPIEHTMSPVMHNAAFAELGLDYAYIACRVAPEGLAGAVSGMRALHFRGFNVTIPHKVAVIPLLDEVDPIAEKIGAVNTVVNDNGILTGYNTDAEGFLQALLERGAAPDGKEIVIIGAGGAARAIAYILAQRNARLTIVNRAEELNWAEALAARIKRDTGREAGVAELTPANLAPALETAAILVNATSVGMHPEPDASPVPAGLLRPGLVVFDAVYNPIRTRLLHEAETAGSSVIGGIDMLAWQGALAFERWTGRKAPLDLMRRQAVRLLEGE